MLSPNGDLDAFGALRMELRSLPMYGTRKVSPELAEKVNQAMAETAKKWLG